MSTTRRAFVGGAAAFGALCAAGAYAATGAGKYDPAAAIALGVRRAYVHESWSREAAAEFREAASKAGKPAPEVVALAVGKAVEDGGIRFTPLPANATRNAG